MDTVKENFQKIAELAKKDDVHVELLLSGGENLRLGYQQKKLQKFESTQTQVAGLRVVDKASQGYAYTENLSLEALIRTYKEALNNSRTVSSNETHTIDLMKPQKVESMAHLFRPEEIPMSDKHVVAKALEEQALAADSRIQNVPYSGFNESMHFHRILNTEGLDLMFKQNSYSGYSYALAKDGESSKMAGESFFVRKFEDIDAGAVAILATEKALSRLNAKQLKTGNYAVVIDRETVPQIFAMIDGYFSAQDVFEGKSLFKGKLNQKIAGESLTVLDDPFDERGPSIRPFDSEGAPSQKTMLIENGVLKNFLTNLEYAKKMSLPHTAHAARSPASAMGIGTSNVVISKGSKSLQQLLGKYDKVVYLTSLTGGIHAGFKESSGDFSLPAEGFLYENGKNTGPVDQFVMSGNVMNLLADIDELGNEYNKEGNSTIAPDVLIKSLSFAGA